jgi:hypothetical protein
MSQQILNSSGAAYGGHVDIGIQQISHCIRPTQSARGLAQSKTLREVRRPLENAPASWTAAALRRFSQPLRRDTRDVK